MPQEPDFEAFLDAADVGLPAIAAWHRRMERQQEELLFLATSLMLPFATLPIPGPRADDEPARN